jgi:drug/metabolite transporter (DMT)-like permease
VRATVGVWTYATIVYAVAALALAAVALGRDVPLTGFAGRDWAVFGALAAGPMLVGHTGMNYALKHYRATTVNVAALGEPVGASLIAWLALGEVPSLAVIVGGAVVLTGIGVTLANAGFGLRIAESNGERQIRNPQSTIRNGEGGSSVG